ncbi:pentatricopeptide repeat-containing protein [Tanacetum coccineum]
MGQLANKQRVIVYFPASNPSKGMDCEKTGRGGEVPNIIMIIKNRALVYVKVNKQLNDEQRHSQNDQNEDHLAESDSPPDNVTYNVLLQGYLRNQYYDDIEMVFREMDGRHYSLDASTLTLLLDQIAAGSLDAALLTLIVLGDITSTSVLPDIPRTGVILYGKEVHARSIRGGYSFQLFVSNALIDMLVPDTVSYAGALSACANIAEIKKGRDSWGLLFDQIFDKDTSSWNTIIGCGMRGEFDTEINLNESRKYSTNQNLYACTVDLLDRAGLMDEAVEMINALETEPYENVRGSFLGACRIHGKIELEARRWSEADKIRVDEAKRSEKEPWLQLHSASYKRVKAEWRFGLVGRTPTSVSYS